MVHQIDHLSLSVSDRGTSIAFYEKLGFQLIKSVTIPEISTILDILVLGGGCQLELRSPLISSSSSNLTEEINGISSFAHFALTVKDLQTELKRLNELGVEPVTPTKKGVLGTFAFIQDPQGNHIELIQH